MPNFDDFLGAPAASPSSSPEPAPPAGPLAWAERYRRIDGQPFALDRFRPLHAIYADDHPHIAVVKPAQRGVSEFAINCACFALDLGATAWATHKDGLNVAYLFPTQQALQDFSKERISGMIGESPKLKEMFGAAEAFGGVGFKQVGKSYLYLRGAWAETGLLSFPCDVLILDEYDRMLPRAVALARRRLNASAVRREIDLSTPTIPGRGIHALYAQSDRHAYEQPCPRCGEWVRYDFHRDVRVDGEDWGVWREFAAAQLRQADVQLTCPQCRGVVSETERVAPGRWVADEPGVKSLRGYHIPALPFPMTDLPRLAVAAVAPDPTEQTEFWRSDLGIPFDADGARVTEALLAALDSEIGQEPPQNGPWGLPTMGVDVGARLHFRVSATHLPTQRRIVREMGSVRAWADLDLLMLRFQIRRCVIDALPELHACRDWAAKFPGRVYRATYPQAHAISARLYLLDDRQMSVQINRTMALDGVYGAIVGGAEHWPGRICRQREVVAHLTAPVRVVGKDQHGQERTSWEHTSPDHYFHACAYDRVALASLLEHPLASKLPVFGQAYAVGARTGRR